MLENLKANLSAARPIYDIYLPTRWKKIVLDDELTPNGATNSDTDSLTDWEEIELLYGLLYRISPNPVHELNRIVVISYLDGPEVGLEWLSHLATLLSQYQPFYAVHADLLERAGRSDEARAAYRLAHDLSQSQAERLYFRKKLSH